MQFPNMFYVDVDKGPVTQVLNPMFLGDALANRVGVYLYKDGEPFSPGGSAFGRAVLSGGETVLIQNGIVSENAIYVDLPSGVYAEQGPVKISVSWTDGTTTTTVLEGTGNVRLTETGTIIDPGTVISDVTALIDAINTAVDSIPEDYTALQAEVDTLNETVELVSPVHGRDYYSLQMGACWQSGVSVDSMRESTTTATVPERIPADTRILAWNDTLYKMGLVPLTQDGKGRGDYYWFESSPYTTSPSSTAAYRTFMIARKDGANIGAVDLNTILYEPVVAPNPIVERINDTATQITDVIEEAEKETWQGFVRYEFPAGFSWSDNPVHDKVSTDGKGRFRVDFNVMDHISTDGLDVYMAADGSDTNDGLTPGTPKLTLTAAIGITNARRVHIAGGYYPREDIQSLSGDIDIIGDPDNRPIFTGQNSGTVWTATETTGVYTTAHKNYGKLYDLTAITNGMFRSYAEASSTSDVQSTQGTYYDDGTTLTVHTFGNIAPTVANTCYTQGWQAMRIVLSGHTLIMANLCFVCSGTYSSRGQLMPVGGDSTRGTFMLYNCDSSYSVRPDSTNVSGGSCINPSNADGIIQYCTSYHSGNDGFSYGAGCRVVEIGCASAYNGTDQLTSCNGSTAHGGSYIRINGSYHDTHGPIVHDVGATESVNLGLSAWHSTCEGKPNFCASGGNVKMWLDSCTGYSSDAGIDVGKPGEPAAGAVIYKRNCSSDVADGVYGGQIVRY